MNGVLSVSNFGTGTTPSSFPFSRNAHWVSLDVFVGATASRRHFISPRSPLPGEKWSMMSSASEFVDHDSLLSEGSS
ncbi:hypothetical protein CEXT_472611 [Caerostris extrusa]|uniref:Uncharacterized protein n=1 Tax=Caerostris extrusa TaxID=172846 RepID=A0AAV4T001_CAEEX|nr:hypothetical protein CEXT_472611 [Caerostris extrusa]